jgi:branched-chain amino acid transport system ATP-binding protein
VALQAEGLHRHFGGLRAVNGVDLAVQAGERRAIIGPNGAGKTTLFNLLSGAIAPTRGRVLLAGRDVTRLPVHARARLGLARTFQRNNLFLGLSALENVRLAVQARARLGSGWLADAARLPELERAAREALERVGLGERAGVLACNLAHGEQRALEVAIALACQPRVLLLDEPTAGLSPAETAALTDLLRRLPRDLTLLIIEHDLDVVFALADMITVLHLGEVIAEGPPDRVRRDDRVRGVYLRPGEEFPAGRP